MSDRGDRVCGAHCSLDESVYAFGEPDFLINGLEQKGTGIRGEFPAVKADSDGCDFVAFVVAPETLVDKSGVVMILCVWSLVENVLQYYCNFCDNNILPQRPLSK